MNIVTIPQPTTARPQHAERLRQAVEYLDQNPGDRVHLPGISSNIATSTLGNLRLSGMYSTATYRAGILLKKVTE